MSKTDQQLNYLHTILNWREKLYYVNHFDKIKIYLNAEIYQVSL